jgi:hypothetical protein
MVLYRREISDLLFKDPLPPDPPPLNSFLIRRSPSRHSFSYEAI